MRKVLVVCAMLIFASAAFAQVRVQSGWGSTAGWGGYYPATPFVPMIATPGVSFATYSANSVGASNATEGLAIIKSPERIDLLFTDVIIPGGMNGRQLATEAVKRRPGLKVLYTSGYTENAIVHHGRLDAGVLLLPKPYLSSDLARMIRVALAS